MSVILFEDICPSFKGCESCYVRVKGEYIFNWDGRILVIALGLQGFNF